MVLTNPQWEKINSMIFQIYVEQDQHKMRVEFLSNINTLIPHDISFFDLGCKKNTKVFFFDPVSNNMENEWLLAYYKDYEPVDTMYWFFSQEENNIYRESDFVSESMNDTSIFYREWMKPQNVRYSTGSRVAHNGVFFGSVNLWRSADHGDFTEEDVYILGLLNKHLSIYFYNKFPNGIKRNSENDYTDTFMHLYHLTERESQIVNLIYQGMSIKEISSNLFISENTVKKHTYNIFQKMNISNRSQLLKILYSYTDTSK